MFQVARFDPKAEKRKLKEKRAESRKRKKKGKKSGDDLSSKKKESKDGGVIDTEIPEQRQRSDSSDDKPKKSLYVIAEDQTKTSIKSAKKLPETNSKNRGANSLLAEEAFDDLEIDVEELIGDTSGIPDQQEDENMNQNAENADRRGKKSNDRGTNDAADVSQASIKELKVALRASHLPLEEAANRWNLAPFLLHNLRRDGFASFFPIQSLVIPDVIASERHAHIRVQDVCVTAPTGSGKSLSFVLPILNSLSKTATAASSSSERRLRALMILPNRDLATQVYNVVESYMKGSNMRVGLALGQTDFVAELSTLVLNETSSDSQMLQARLSFDPGNLDLALDAFQSSGTTATSNIFNEACPPRNGWSNVDVLVCTPGRLVDHLDNTPGFTLQHLRFLVVDEADRLLSQSYHNWIDRVMESANSASVEAWKEIIQNDNKLPSIREDANSFSYKLEPITWRRGGTSGDYSDTFNTNDAYFSMAASVCQPVQLRKFLVSATLTRDPRKLAALRLVNPKHFNVHQLNNAARPGATVENNEVISLVGSKKYSMPATMEEYFVECTAEQKPIVLLAVLLERLKGEQVETSEKKDKKRIIVIFTSSIDSTHRLARLLQLLWLAAELGAPDCVAEFSSSLRQKERSLLLEKANDSSSGLSVIVCSDGLSRGMDIEYVDAVINYDVPVLAKTYVHRCGRTARASRKGAAISLLKGGQLYYFQKMRKLIQSPEKIQPLKIKKSLVAGVIPRYKQCIKALRDVLDAEENGELGHTDFVDEDYLV